MRELMPIMMLAGLFGATAMPVWGQTSSHTGCQLRFTAPPQPYPGPAVRAAEATVNCQPGNTIMYSYIHPSQTSAGGWGVAPWMLAPVICDYGHAVVLTSHRERDVDITALSCVFAGVRNVVMGR